MNFPVDITMWLLSLSGAQTDIGRKEGLMTKQEAQCAQKSQQNSTHPFLLFVNF